MTTHTNITPPPVSEEAAPLRIIREAREQVLATSAAFSDAPEDDPEREILRIRACAASTRLHNAYATYQEGLRAGDAFTIGADTPRRCGPYGRQEATEWVDGVPMAGTYIFRGRFRARRYDGVEVTFPTTWRMAYNWYRHAALATGVIR